MKPQAKLHIRRPIARRQQSSDLSEHAAAIGFGVAAFLVVIVLSAVHA